MTKTDLIIMFADVARRVKRIHVCGLDLHIRQISALERDEYFAWVSANTTEKSWIGSSSYAAALGLCEPDGTPWYATPAKDYVEVGKALPGHVVEAISREVLAYNLIGKQAADDLAKN